MNTDGDWIDRVLNTVAENLQWQALGTLAYRVSTEGELLIAPAGAEVLGGRHDGEQIFPFYTLSVTAVAELFDEIPEIHLNTHPTASVCFIGTIRRESAVVMIFTYPFPDDEYEFRIYGDGAWGLKSS